MKLNANIVLIILVAILCCRCGESIEQGKAGREIAAKHCGGCHALPEPSLLDRNTWREDVLPVMARKLGLDYIYEKPLQDSTSARLSMEDFHRIAEWYFENSPDSMPLLQRNLVETINEDFSSIRVAVKANQFPSTSFVKIDSTSHAIYAANAFDSTLQVYDENLTLIHTRYVGGSLVDLLRDTKEKKFIATLIGTMNPNDLKDGSLLSFPNDFKAIDNAATLRAGQLPRPVQTIACDLDNNDTIDYLVCGFGNTTGGFYRLTNTYDGTEQTTLKAGPGAIRAYAEDMNADGFKDILLMTAQEREGIFILYNEGSNHFKETEVLSFPAVYGSSYFELADFNNDGFKDILYTCGDNGDFTSKVAKNYHGLYIYLNDGNNHFVQHYFFPMYGCYKAMARDFDRDGDLDIATISYFPSLNKRHSESFIYLEQVNPFSFIASTIRNADEGRWLTMDAGDADGDGDDDIILGSFIPPYAKDQEKWKRQGSQKTALLLLLNKTR